MTSTDLALIPPRLMERGVQMIERDGYRTLGIPPKVREQYNVIFPTVELSQSNPDFAPMLREIALSIATDAYTGATFHKNAECSLAKNGLLKLGEAAKVEIDTERIPAAHLGPTERCGWKATVAQRHSDGTLTRTSSSAVFDNEAERAKVENEVRAARAYENGQRTNKPKFATEEAVQAELAKRWTQKTLKASELTETIAIERALRAVLKLPHKMAASQFEKPWLVLCYGFLPQTPEARAEAAHAMAQLYGDTDAGTPAVALPPAPPLAALPAGDPQPDDRPDEQGEPSFDSEPVLEADVIDEQEEEDSRAAGDVEALARAAARMKPPKSGMQEYTLEQIAGRPGAERWFEWALGQDFTALDPQFNVHVRAFCAVHFPHLLEQAAA